jgi:hypothetical protein
LIVLLEDAIARPHDVPASKRSSPKVSTGPHARSGSQQRTRTGPHRRAGSGSKVMWIIVGVVAVVCVAVVVLLLLKK